MLKIHVLGLKQKVHLSSCYEELTYIYMALIVMASNPIRGLGNICFITIVLGMICNCYMSL